MRTAQESSEERAEESIFALSRALYRRLVPYLASGAGAGSRQRVLDACETTMLRLEHEPNFARPGRFLFEEIRTLFPIGEQLWVRKSVELHIAVARQLIDRIRAAPRQCAAFNRAGAPCQREPRPGSEYCPSHRHLEGLEELARLGAEAEGAAGEPPA